MRYSTIIPRLGYHEVQLSAVAVAAASSLQNVGYSSVAIALPRNCSRNIVRATTCRDQIALPTDPAVIELIILR